MDYDDEFGLGEADDLMNDPDDEWRPIAKFDGYFISNRGQVHSTKRDKNLALSKSNGKNAVKLSRKGLGQETKQVDRLVAEAFLPNPNGTRYIKLRHLDGDVLNDDVDNLEWINYPRSNYE